VLGTFILALDDDARGQVGDPHRRVGFVNVLAARTAGAECIHAQVIFIDLYDDVLLDFRVHKHRSEGRVAALAGVER